MLKCAKHYLEPCIPCDICDEEERRVQLATKLALFLGMNEVTNYVSPSGYKLKIITRREPLAATGTPWHQTKEDAA